MKWNDRMKNSTDQTHILTLHFSMRTYPIYESFFFWVRDLWRIFSTTPLRVLQITYCFIDFHLLEVTQWPLPLCFNRFLFFLFSEISFYFVFSHSIYFPIFISENCFNVQIPTLYNLVKKQIIGGSWSADRMLARDIDWDLWLNNLRNNGRNQIIFN